MFDEKKALKFLREHLNPHRVEHSVRVMETAVKYAKIWGVDEEKAKIAGLLHDSGKWNDKDATLKKVDEFGIILNEEERDNFHLVHGVLGSFIAKYEFGIEDREIIEAIRFHVTARKNMTTLDKVVYLADKLEPARKYDGVDELRKLAETDIDKAIMGVFDGTIKLLVDRGETIATETIEARNWLLMEK